MRTFIDLWAPEIAPWVKILSYESLLVRAHLPRATYIFSDIERLRPDQLPGLEAICKTLENEQSSQRILNHPSRSMKRYELLRKLYDKGYNKHNIFRTDEIPLDLSFPVFVRGENDHSGSLTGLIHTWEELSGELGRLQSQTSRDKVVVGFCDSSDCNGLYRKYSAFIVSDRIIPQHMMISDRWHMKGVRDLALRKKDLYEEREYLRDNPHENTLREICSIAKITYGRIDYSVVDDKPVVWEINTNPTLMSIHNDLPKCCVTRSPFVQKMINVFTGIDCHADPRDVLSSPAAHAGVSHFARGAIAYMDDSFYYFRHSLMPRLRKHRRIAVTDLKRKITRVLLT
jgi:hypothetical protein